MKKFVFIMTSIFFTVLALTADGTALAGNPPEIKIGVSLDSLTYNSGEPISVTLSLANEGDVNVITSKGFSDTPFPLMLRFMDEQGNIIASKSMGDANRTPSPPSVFVDESSSTGITQGEPVEILAAKNTDGTYGWTAVFPPFDANEFYPLAGRSGYFTVKAIVPMTTYPENAVQGDLGLEYATLGSADWYGTIESNITGFTLVGDSDGDDYYYPEQLPGDTQPVDCDDANPAVNPGAVEIMANGIDDDCNPGTLDVIVENFGVLYLRADKHTVGTGSHPGSVKDSLVNLPVRVYDKSPGSCVAGFGVSWKNYQTIWENCSSPEGIGITDESGTAKLSLPPGDYIVIARYDPDDPVVDDGDEIYLGVSVGTIDPGVTIDKYLQMIVKADGKKTPAKYTRRKGSDLLIIEPEYIEWDGTQELYPFVFDSIGDWSVTTSVAPPEGFVADSSSLSEEVLSEVEAVQFTITDVGSKWISTSVIHTVKHKGKTEKIISKIGIKLTKKLAKKKGLGIYGDEGRKHDHKEKNEK